MLKEKGSLKAGGREPGAGSRTTQITILPCALRPLPCASGPDLFLTGRRCTHAKIIILRDLIVRLHEPEDLTTLRRSSLTTSYRLYITVIMWIIFLNFRPARSGQGFRLLQPVSAPVFPPYRYKSV